MSTIDRAVIRKALSAFQSQTNNCNRTIWVLREEEVIGEDLHSALIDFIYGLGQVCGSIDGCYAMTREALTALVDLDEDDDLEDATGTLEAPVSYSDLITWLDDCQGWSDVDDALADMQGTKMSLFELMQIAYVRMLEQVVYRLIEDMQDWEFAQVEEVKDEDDEDAE
jgi:hypothetical protein